jgi:uncharacterized protein
MVGRMHDMTSDTALHLERYVAAWNEADPVRRRAAIDRLYAGDGLLITPSVQVSGRERILDHIGEVFAEFVGSSGQRFRHTASTRNHQGVLLRWELSRDGARATASGVIALLLGPEGRIVIDHQFGELLADNKGIEG